MLPMLSLTCGISLENTDDDFKDLPNTLQLDTVGDYIKTYPIILMFGARTFAASKRKEDKVTERKRTTRSRKRLTTRLHLCFREICKNQSEITLPDTLMQPTCTAGKQSHCWGVSLILCQKGH